jgi:hypothetical protein
MNVRLDPADSMKVNAWHFYDLMSQIVIEPVLDRRRDHWQTGFGVPSDVEVDLGVYAVGHFVLCVY